MAMSDHDTTSGTQEKVKRRRRHRRRPTWEVALLFPLQGTWTEDEYLELDRFVGDEARVELSRGRLAVLPIPTELHQFILAYFYKLLRAFVSAHAPGTVLFCGIKLKLKTGRFRLPDIVYMKAENAHRRHEEFWDGADLVMETVSGDLKDRKRDHVTKLREYAEAGIPEYWIIDPAKSHIRVMTLQGQVYKLHGEFGPGTQATSVLLPGFTVSVDEALAPPDSK
jgi:Uma2 family endonuclease